MGGFFLFLLFLISAGTMVGLFKPSIVKLKSRLAVLGIGMPAFIVTFLLWGVFGLSKNSKAMENPENAISLRMGFEKHKTTPEILRKCERLERLSLRGNQIEELDSSIFLNLTSLQSLDISKNPIKELPVWLLKLPRLKDIRIDDTEIEIIDSALTQKFEISYKDTPYEIALENYKAENPDSIESFTDFAVRKLSGNEYGYSLEFKETNDEVLYITPVTEEQAQKIGEYLTESNFFIKENNVSVQAKFDHKIQAYIISFVMDESLYKEEMDLIFEMFRSEISAKVFDNKETHVLICDQNLVEFRVLTGNE